MVVNPRRYIVSVNDAIVPKHIELLARSLLGDNLALDDFWLQVVEILLQK